MKAFVAGLPRPPAGLTKFAAPAISIAILGVALFELHVMEIGAILAIVPRNPLFWLLFVCAWCLPVVAEWCIYRQIWHVPGSAMTAMARKFIGNEMLIGYAGETYLYTWARRSGRTAATAFGAVKDVSILSASVGSAVTLGVAAITAPFLSTIQPPLPTWTIMLSLGLILLPPTVAILGRKRLFHLAAPLLMRITAIHAVRSVGGLVLTATLWHLALPEVAISWWVIFSAMKTLLSRLPLVSNRDLVFAGAVAAILGQHGDVPALMAMMASLTVVANVTAGLAIGAGGVLGAVVTRGNAASVVPA